MSLQQRNFWIVLTIFALAFAAVRWSGVWRTRSCELQKSSCSATMIHKLPHIDEQQRLDHPPQVLNQSEVRRRVVYSYSCGQRRRGIEGEIVARVLVDERGKYVRHRIISRSSSELAHRCNRQLPYLRFRPAFHNGKPQPAWVDVRLQLPY